VATDVDADRDRQTKHALTHLTRLAKRVPGQTRLLESALRQRLATVAKAAIEVSIETGEPMGAALAQVFRGEGTADLAVGLHDLLPSETVALRELAVDVTKLTLEWHLAHNPTVDRMVALLHNYAQRLVAVGHLDHAFAVAQRSRELMAGHPASRMDPRLSIGMARVLADTGHYESAVASLQADLPALRARLEDGGVEAQWDLAFALHNLGASLSELGSALEARSIFGEVLEIRRRMAKDGDNDKVLALAESLVVAGAVESDLGAQRRALRWTDEALALLEPLSDRLPDALRQIVAQALQNHASTWFDLGDLGRSERLGRKAAELVEDLVDIQLLAFGPLYVSVLRTVANAALARKQWRQALDAASRAEEVARKLAASESLTLLASLPEALAIKGAALSGLGRTDEAGATLEECLEVRRTLAKRDPARFKMDLVRALNNFANGVGWDRRPLQALACAKEAVALQERQRRLIPSSDPTLAATLDTLGCRLAALLFHRAALRYTVRAGIALARPVQRFPDRYADWMHTFIGHIGSLRWRVPNGACSAALSALRARLEKNGRESFGSGLNRAQHNKVRRLVGHLDMVSRSSREDGRRKAVRQLRAARSL
jgi:tetratricopeptide (TPR) repeat protein